MTSGTTFYTEVARVFVTQLCSKFYMRNSGCLSVATVKPKAEYRFCCRYFVGLLSTEITLLKFRMLFEDVLPYVV